VNTNFELASDHAGGITKATFAVEDKLLREKMKDLAIFR
jgi:hypothetical protein